MGVFVGSCEPDYQRPPRTLTSVLGNIEFECGSPAGRGCKHISSTLGLRAEDGTWNAGSRPRSQERPRPPADAARDSPLEPSSLVPPIEAALESAALCFPLRVRLPWREHGLEYRLMTVQKKRGQERDIHGLWQGTGW